MMYGVLLDEAHDAACRVCTKEQVLAHPRPTDVAIHTSYYKNVALPRKNGRQAATKNIFASQQACAIIFGFIKVLIARAMRSGALGTRTSVIKCPVRAKAQTEGVALI